jgi:hypothetical protein
MPMTRMLKSSKSYVSGARIIKGMSNSSVSIARSGTLVDFVMTRLKTIILIVPKQRTCYVCYAAMPSQLPNTVSGAAD